MALHDALGLFARRARRVSAKVVGDVRQCCCIRFVSFLFVSLVYFPIRTRFRPFPHPFRTRRSRH
ncbi:uncharacterized protein STEHIDRAFT_123188, partial [Stereum hirsutum FP-91666 SS1]|uniref:uncharacterized protein n=1 Tax=Stereum hirsutum (strain FP-91666) TaxID=721885 RepID=UPI0004449D03